MASRSPLTISHLRVEKMRAGPGSDEDEKWVVYFQGAKKGAVLSKTLAKQIAAAVGSDDTDNWPGRAVELFPEHVKVAGNDYLVIRARVAAKAAQPSGNGSQG